MGVERLRPQGLACLAAAQGHPVGGGGGAAEVGVEGEHAVDLGAGEVEDIGDDGDILVGHPAEAVVHLVEDRQQGTIQAGQPGCDAPHLICTPL